MCIGEGAFAAVYRVRQNALDRWVAVKVLDEKDQARKREIIKEATTQAKIAAACIPQVYHVFEWKRRVWIVMEWIRGVSLSTILARNPSHEQRLWLADGCIRSLACLHNRGFAHRDLKPANILISPDRGVVLVDFGFSRKVIDGQKSIAGVVKGTPAYMAPELWLGKPGVDSMRCDVYALGKVLRDTLPEEHTSALSALCAHDTASKRPANAEAVLDMWKKDARDAGPAADWRVLSHDPTSYHLSEKLVAAARVLLSRGRQDEAYWLLVESIEENPAHTEAVLLMNSFPKYVAAKKKQRRLTYAVSIVLSVCLLLLAFVIGWNSRGWNGAGVADASRQRDAQDRFALIARALKSSSPADFAAARAPLREDLARESPLKGTIFIAAHPLQGTLRVDGEPVEQRAGLPNGVMLSYGRHTLSWVDDNGKTLWREKINLLPFETMIVSMAAQQQK
jgi:predicted Ser/Thr protein kinase